MSKFIRPVHSTRISDDFAAHVRRGTVLPGTDYPVAIGTSVYAAADGVVTRAATQPKSGKNIRIKHSDGSVTYYLHLSRLDVTNGQHVKQGQVIGLSGNTGNSTGPHLHFSYADPAGVLRDPEKILSNDTPKPVPARRTIKFGSRGIEVEYLQRKLGVKPVSGYFGPLTRKAVIKFQKTHRLAADGIVGPSTWKALG